jgi:hypothetical protein
MTLNIGDYISAKDRNTKTGKVNGTFAYRILLFMNDFTDDIPEEQAIAVCRYYRSARSLDDTNDSNEVNTCVYYFIEIIDIATQLLCSSAMQEIRVSDVVEVVCVGDTPQDNGYYSTQYFEEEGRNVLASDCIFANYLFPLPIHFVDVINPSKRMLA